MDQIYARYNAASGFEPVAFNEAFDALCGRVNFVSEAESIHPLNVETARIAFQTFLEQMQWPLARWSFEDLLAEKIGEFAFRADGKTPNWYHEFRECLYYLGMVRAGFFAEGDVLPFGGLEAGVATILRHDSWEDLGKDRLQIFTSLERKLYQANARKEISDSDLHGLHIIATHIVEGVDALTRKMPVMDAYGHFERKPNGKLLKQDRFDGDLNLYMDKVLQNPNTALAKFIDAIEGMQTRFGVSTFSDEDHRKYAEERRSLFGHRRTDIEAIEKFQFLKDAIVSSDAVLGILLQCTESVLNFKNPGFNPVTGHPIRLDAYVSRATMGYNCIPAAFHPVCIITERLEAVATQEAMAIPRSVHTRMLLDRVLLPSLRPHFPMLKMSGPPIAPFPPMPV